MFVMAVAIGLRNDLDAMARWAIAKRVKGGPQARRVLWLAANCDGGARSEPAKIDGGVGLRLDELEIRSWRVQSIWREFRASAII
jgi:hypothetical protein